MTAFSNLRFSIITSCYRGDRHLPSLYEQLLLQYDSGWQFEWILVDDFSNDGGKTTSCIKRIVDAAPFPAKSIFFDKNYHASRSVHEAIKIASGDYVIILDQDDFLSCQAFSIFTRLIGKYSHLDSFAGVCGRCIDLSGKLIGTPFKWHERLSNELEIRHIDKIRGELYQCTRRDVIARFCSDLKPGYTNGHVWTRIARHYQYAYTSEVVRIYDTTNPDSHSNSKMIRNVENVCESYLYYLSANVDYLRKDPRSYITLLIHCLRFAALSRVELNTLAAGMPADLRLLAVLLNPVGGYLARLDHKNGRVPHV